MYHSRWWSVPNLFYVSASFPFLYVDTNGPPELWTGRSEALPYVLHPWFNDTKMESYQKLFFEKSSLVWFFLPTWVSDAQQEDHDNTNYICVRRRQKTLLSHKKVGQKCRAHFFLIYESTFPSIFLDIPKSIASLKACSFCPLVFLMSGEVSMYWWYGTLLELLLLLLLLLIFHSVAVVLTLVTNKNKFA